MGLPFDLIPFTKREMPNHARVYNHFPQDFRSRFFRIFNPYIGKQDIRTIYLDFYTEFSGEIEYFQAYDDGSMHDPKGSHKEFLLEGDDELLIDYMEYVINYAWENYSSDEMLKCDGQLRRALREERVLFRLKPDREYVSELHNDLSVGYKPSVVDKAFGFEYIGSEPMVQADEDLRVFEYDPKWAEAIDHYNNAWEYYQDGKFDSSIPEELTKAIENIANTICKEENDWVDTGVGLGGCLNEMKEQGLFEPNNELYPESERIFTGIKLSVQKAAGDKHGHQEVNQHYVILLLHQTAAFITYIINRYKELND